MEKAGRIAGTSPGLIAFDATAMANLDKELAYYKSIQGDLLRGNEAGYALIRGENFFGAFNSAAAANAEGRNRFGNHPFLVKKIERETTAPGTDRAA
jgi:hypothetical protein